MKVALVRWPSDERRRALLLAARQPVLLLVESDDPPTAMSVWEDWIRVPCSDADLEARVGALARRTLNSVNTHFWPYGAPILEGEVLTFHAKWVSLSPIEVRLVNALLDRAGAVIPRQTMVEAGWPDRAESAGGPSHNALDAHVNRLRRRLVSVRLTIRTVRARGYVLDQLKP